MYPHRIRLRGPWEYAPRSGPTPLPAPGRMTMPCRWRDGGLPGFSGTVCFRRHFGYPGRIDSFERVWLTFAGLTGTAHIRLNEQELGVLEEAAGEFEVTSFLQNRNVLEVQVAGPEHGGLWGEVALEIRCAAFLRNLRACRSSSSIHVAGEVAGTCEENLELVVFADRANAGHAIVHPGPFDLTINLPPGAEPAVLRVELVCVATVWYAAEIPLPN